MEIQRLLIRNKNDEVVRSLAWDGRDLSVVYRNDLGRLELVDDTTELDEQEIPYKLFGTVNAKSVRAAPFVVSGLGRLEFLETPKHVNHEHLAEDVEVPPERKRAWWGSLLFLLLIQGAFIVALFRLPLSLDNKIDEKKPEDEHIVKIVKPNMEKAQRAEVTNPTQVTQKTVTKKAVKRMGALAVLGSLSKSGQKGGLNLGQVNTSAGPGLGGLQGSGGMQTTLYGKGIIAAPLGVGGRADGAGGYGTKGKGGGQAGYGTLSLVGSAGTELVPVGSDAIVEGGLDRDAIADVIARNLGQVRFCYEQGLQSDPSLAGRVAVDWVIGAQGTVKSAGIRNTTMNSKQVEDCILMRLKSWKFPLPAGGVDVRVTFPFVLKRTGKG